MDILPDSRLTVSKGLWWHYDYGWMVPIFCANCGAAGGFVPEHNMTFAFYLCDSCSETYGIPAGHMAMPDEVFWDRVKQEMLEKFGRLLTYEEILDVVAADASPLATLIKEGTPKGD